MANDSSAYSHQEWIGYVQPVGVVVSTSALIQAGAAINRNFIPLHKSFLGVLPQDRDANPIPELSQFPRFAMEVLGWRSEDLTAPDDSLTIPISGYEDVLCPNYAVKDGSATLLLISIVKADFDADPMPEPRHWNAAPQMRFERLLRETGIPAGLLVSPTAIRLVYAPKGESSGHITFKIVDMVQIAGRPILAALHMLVSADRLFTLAEDQRLPALLAISRRHQNLVSTQLSGQVMEALFDLLRGFQAAHDQTGILREVLHNDPNQVYAGLLTVLLRLVFVLYAEDRGLLSSDETYLNNYSVGGLFERLREDQAHHPDTMDQRYGAWARLLALFRLIYRGARHDKMRIPGRKGYLFDPDRYPFLEGRPDAHAEQIQIPRVPDGVLYRVLTRLLILDGERLSYRNLDVEQIGSVYEAMMGFELHVAQGPSIAIKPKKRSGAPVTINLADLLAITEAKRNEWLHTTTDQKLMGHAERGLKQARSIDDLIAALDRRIAKNVTPSIVPARAMILQPSAERRRTGSHYTPRSLTQPIVEAAIAPVLNDFGAQPTPEQILSLKVCDPAMGSGAFLVEACRQLGDALVKAWHDHNELPPLPLDEDELLHARRLVAQRCLYGVDRNELAADLAKLSLWLATLARDHEFTFLNHSLRHGDSLVGLAAWQIAAFDWEPNPALTFLEQDMRNRIARAAHYRKKILDAREDTPYSSLSQQLDLADQELQMGRMAGDILIAAYFEGDKRIARRDARLKYETELKEFLGNAASVAAGVSLDTTAKSLRRQQRPLFPFHWHLEFPEVFDLDDHLRSRRGFDAIVGNPPFMGGSKLSTAAGNRYTSWLGETHPGSRGKADLVAHFFRRAFVLLRNGGTFGLIATNSIRQGDTRESGLFWIRTNGGRIYRAETRKVWPGIAAVVISVVHVVKADDITLEALLDGRHVETITAYLFHMGPDHSPNTLPPNRPLVHSGTNINGKGFVITPQVRDSFIAECPPSAERIRAYLGAEEMNETPDAGATRYVIWAEGLDEEGLKAYPPIYRHLYETVRKQRQGSSEERLRQRWWLYSRPANDLYLACASMRRILASGRAGTHLSFVFQPTSTIFSDALTCFIYNQYYGFGLLQSRVHEAWAHFFGSSLKDDPRYIPEDCFETFPLPPGYETNTGLEFASREYYEHRASIMLRSDKGLTDTYNRFHDPNDTHPEIALLRRLHDAMDRAVLDAYTWGDIATNCEFFPEFEDDEDDEADTTRPKAKRYRYRWPDAVHDEVLARLLTLNLKAGSAEFTVTANSKQSGTKKRSSKKPSDQPILF